MQQAGPLPSAHQGGENPREDLQRIDTLKAPKPMFKPRKIVPD